MFYTIPFYHPNWKNAIALEVPPHTGVYDAVAYLNQSGYIPYHAPGYALSFRGQWLMDNNPAGSLGLQPGEAVMIVPLKARADGKEAQPAAPRFRGRGDGLFANKEAERYFQQEEPEPVVVKDTAKGAFLNWIRKLLS